MKRFVALTLVALFGLSGVAFAQGAKVEKKKEKKPVAVEEMIIELDSDVIIELDEKSIEIEESACPGCKEGKGKCKKCLEKKAKHHGKGIHHGKAMPDGGAISVAGDWESLPPDTKKKMLEQMRKHMSEAQLKQALEQMVRKKHGGSAVFSVPKVSQGREVIIVKEGDAAGRFHIEGLAPGRHHVVRQPAGCPECGGHARKQRPRRRRAAPAHGDGLTTALHALRAEIAALRHEIRGAHAARKPATGVRMFSAPPKAVALPAPKAGKTVAKGGFSFGKPAAGMVVRKSAPPAKPNPELAVLKQQVADLKAENRHMKMMLHEIMKRLDDLKAEKAGKASK